MTNKVLKVVTAAALALALASPAEAQNHHLALTPTISPYPEAPPHIGGSGTVRLGLTAAPAAAQDRVVDVFAGGEYIAHEAAFVPHAGVGLWLAQGFRLSGKVYGYGGVLGVSSHVRLPLNDSADLLFGATPIWLVPEDGVVFYPAIDVIVSGRIAPRIRVEVGPTFYLDEYGGLAAPALVGRLVYSFP